MSYYLIHNFEGSCSIQEFKSKEKLLEELNDAGIEESWTYVSQLDKHVTFSDSKKLANKTMIIKGTIINPKPIKTIKEYSL